MTKSMFGWFAGLFVVASLQAAAPETRRLQTTLVGPAAAPVQAAPVPQSSAAEHASRPMLDQYCVTCHNDRMKTGGLTLQGVNIASPGEHVEVLEKVVRKLRAGAMPPLGAPRPDPAAMGGFVASIERELDKIAAAHPNPGRTETFHRLNRTEYGNAIRDLLELDVDVASLVPADESSFGFDNIAGVLKVSPVFMERYATAAQKVSRLAVGSMTIPASESTFRLSSDINQDDYQEGLPIGTRGGTLVRHYFPLDAEYEIKVSLMRNGFDQVPRFNDQHALEVTIDGERAEVFTVGEARQPGGGRGSAAPRPPADAAGVASSDDIPPVRPPVRGDFTLRLPVKAGTHELGTAFIKKSSALTITPRRWFLRPMAGIGDTRYEPQVGGITVAGPFNPTGPGDTPTRHRIFTCRPSSDADEARCGKLILSTLARRAYRRPVTAVDLQPLMAFFEQGRSGTGNFEAGIELALRRLLVSPAFLLRTSQDPPNIAPDTVYRISDVELASRLSFFLWSSIPDDELLDLAVKGKLKDPTVLNQQVRRMLADPRSEALIKNFAGQWLYLRNVPDKVTDGGVFPDFEGSLRGAFRRETEMFFGSILRDENASVLELLRANYTFLNQQLAQYYGIKDVYGGNFRRVELSDDVRLGGLLGQGSILFATSYPTRTAPTIRGKWIMSTLLGIPPPEPPPNIPALKENAAGQAVADTSSVRARLEQHRANPACAGCHKLMDPLGLALENFDAIGRWRTKAEDGKPIDPSTQLFDGTNVDGPAAVRDALLSHPESIVRTTTERLLTYALGRGTEYYDYPTIRSIVKNAGDSNASLTNIIVGIANSIPFQLRRSQS
jgi:mono/diheme cytochrome c family protein